MQHSFSLRSAICLIAALFVGNFLAAQCADNLNNTNFGFENGDLVDYGSYGNSGLAITSASGEVINGGFSVTVQNDDAVTKFFYQSVTPGNEYNGTILTNELVSGGYAQIQIQWFMDDGTGGVGALIGSNINGSYVANGLSTLTAVAPAGALHAQLILQAGGGTTVVADDICLVDNTANSALFDCPGNLVTNGDFEAGTQSWYSFTGVSVDGTNDADTGVGAAVVPVGAQAATNFTAGVIPGNLLLFSGSLKSSDANISIEFRNENTNNSTYSGTGSTTDPANYTRVQNILTIPEGTTLLQLIIQSNSGQVAVLDDVCVQDMGPDPNFVFPVTFASFTGEAMPKANKLSWTTASEDNVATFYVERSLNGHANWHEISTVSAVGNSQVAINYTEEDGAPFATSYYRLRSMDFDGSSQLSEVVFVERSDVAKATISPNPFQDVLSISTSFEATTNYFLIDALGRTVLKGNILAGARETNISTVNVPSGRYVIRVGSQSILGTRTK